jgi:hypothetical protein
MKDTHLELIHHHLIYCNLSPLGELSYYYLGEPQGLGEAQKTKTGSPLTGSGSKETLGASLKFSLGKLIRAAAEVCSLATQRIQNRGALASTEAAKVNPKRLGVSDEVNTRGKP